jgi:ubiquinone/menaquinone biosynthesis C-methylase UbiE
MAFQATTALLRLGILETVAEEGEAGICARDVAEKLGLGEYGVRVLLDMGLSAGLVWMNDGRYALDKIGFFILNDEMTRINLDFVKDVCYAGMDDLQASIENGAPEGLRHFGDWPTIYQGLTALREPARTSWFAFDHYYSTKAFPEALRIVFATKPRHVLDIGGNTGKWALACAEYDSSVRVTIADLPEQTAVARKIIGGTDHGARIDTCDIDLLDPAQSLPEGADTLWMSQFLDCFSEDQIVAILKRAACVMQPHSSLFVLETLCDRQEHEAAAYSLNATSLYFTSIANGTSRMYDSKTMQRLIRESGLQIAAMHEHLGRGHTLLQCFPERSSKS